MKSKVINELTTAEILEKIETEKLALIKMKLNHAVSPLENPNKIKESKKLIARLLTILKEREIKTSKN